MRASFFSREKRHAASKKIVIFLLFFMFIFSAISAPIRPAQAQMVVTDIPKLVWDKINEILKSAWKKSASIALQQTLRTALNKMAYDAAVYVGSGKEGRKSLFVNQSWGSYMASMGDEAAGDFLEKFSKEMASSTGKSIDFCQPSSLAVKVSIGLGLQQQIRPSAPTCTASKMISNWENAAQRLTDYKSPDFLERFKDVFNPYSNDLGIYVNSQRLMTQKQASSTETAKTTLIGKGGWFDLTDIAGNPKTAPDQAKNQLNQAQQAQTNNMLKVTGDAFVDAANVFLNQLSITLFNRLMQNIGKKSPSSQTDISSLNLSLNQSDPNASLTEVGAKEDAIKLTQPNFGVRADYNILADLSVCVDKKNPGPTNCVIDSKFMQAISERLTVAEALKGGYLQGGWQFVLDSQPGIYESAYSWRNISILRQYRIVPASWETAFQKMDAYRTIAKDPVKNQNGQFKAKKATLMDLVSCFDPYDEYNQFSNDFDSNDQAWCTGLVDPNWVLKAPLNYCKKDGVGSQIVNKSIIPSIKETEGTAYVPSSIEVVRAENYCADNLTCIKETEKGGCSAYGYCNEEKRTWSFEGDSCEPISNTCQTYVNSSDNKTYSYLENTLDYSGCSSNNAGCKKYSYAGSYDAVNNKITWSGSSNIYLNNRTSSCTTNDEGCSEFIRVKPTWGANLVMDADLGNDQVGDTSSSTMMNDWPITGAVATIVNAEERPGGSTGKAIEMAGSGTIYSSLANSLLPDNLSILPNQAYTLSADLFASSGNVVLAIGTDITKKTVTTTATGVWQHISVTRKSGDDFSGPDFSIIGTGAFYVKNVKFEMSDWDTGFSSYGALKSYQKLLPQYLENACYETGLNGYTYELKADAPAKCSNYSRKCSQGEVGCDSFKSSNNGLAVPAKTSTNDYCDSQCLGYDVYITRSTFFNSPQVENLIPSTAQACSAVSAGCNEFTNLDSVATGGEQKEYYTSLKYCIKPSEGTCAPFYAWEGTNGGYQLRLFSLEKAAAGGPKVVSDDSALCNSAIYHAPLTSPLYNPDCQEFYDAAGQIYYHLNSRVISCSDNCVSYRMSEKNYDTTLAQAACTGADKSWDAAAGACISCINGGVWNATHRSCVYKGIPGEGTTCSADVNGCREYNGNQGNNIRLVSSSNFESSTTDWTSNCAGGIKIDTVSNNRYGHSLLYNNAASCGTAIGSDVASVAKGLPLIKQLFASDNLAAQLRVGASVTGGKAYSVRFLASSPLGANVKMYFYNKSTQERSDFNAGQPIKIAAGGSWQIYSANLENLSHQTTVDEILVITADGDFHLDNFTLTEITDRYYLIKSSSKIPDVCYYDILGVYQGADYNLGCTTYVDRAGTGHNLHSFTGICADSSVGCEQVISTSNYDSYKSKLWGDLNYNGVCDPGEPECFKVDRDNGLYLIFDKTKQCNVADIGCSLMGLSKTTGDGVVWSDVYKKNNPNKYDSIMCTAAGVGCEEWKNNDTGGSNYFRDPGDNTCVYRYSNTKSSAKKAWYQSPVKRCDLNTNGQIDSGEQGSAVCGSVSDCNGKPCVLDNNDYLCDVDYLKTVGYGGAGNRVAVPSNRVGVCEAAYSGCREYIDPVSKFNPTLLSPASSTVSLIRNKLYVLQTTAAVDGVATGTTLTFYGDVKPLLSNNTFGTSTKTISIGGASREIIFNSLDNYSAIWSASSTGAIAPAEVRELAIGYQKASSIDKSSCNGMVDFNNGCVLFNERSIVGASGYAKLDGQFNPYQESQQKVAPAKCSADEPGSCAANALIKVRPDRVCSGWLDCTTFAKDPATGANICYDVQQCNSLNDKNECNNFVSKPVFNQANATGYSYVNKYNVGEMVEVGLNTEAHYDFEELIPPLSCSRSDGKLNADGTPAPCNFDRNIVKDLIIREPEKAKVEYPVSGKSYLRVPSAFIVSPQPVNGYFNLSPDQDYYLSYLVNTQNSSAAAVIVVEPNGNPAQSVTSTATSTSGWSRRVSHFKTTATTTQARIKLLSSNTSTEGEIYFDDINIEPVLKVSDKEEYVARECRLYPSSDSLGCKNQVKNVIKDGLEGYCLEHDKDNPSVCTSWYPSDQISSSNMGAQSLGYNGQLGLSYCTNVNSNVKFAKKVTTKLVYVGIDETKDSIIGAIIGGVLCGPGCALIGSLFGNPCPDNWSDPNNIYNACHYCFPSISTSTMQQCINSGYNTGYINASGTAAFYENCQQCSGAGSGGVWPMNVDGCSTLPDPLALSYCGSSKYYSAIFVNDKQNWNHERVYCVPKINSPYTLINNGVKISATMLSVGVPEVPTCDAITFYREAWMEYDGVLANSPVVKCQPDGDITTECAPINEYNNATPPIRVFNSDYPPVDEQGLQYLSADSGDRDKVFNFSCSSFAQVIAGNGSNKAWVTRVSPAADPLWAFETPSFMNTTTGPLVQLQKYGRQRLSAPYGAATFPYDYDLLNSGPVFLQNQYYIKDNKKIFGGRPYGCSGSSCSMVGYCDQNPSVLCLYDPFYALNPSVNTDYINRKTCSDGGFGTCKALWATTTGLSANSVIGDLFRQSYGTFSYREGSYIPSAIGNNWNFGIGESPRIDGVRLEFNGNNIGKSINATTTGVYALKFNSNVNADQQPLKMIVINWGDGNKQAITGYDHRPDVGNPHVFYHYYIARPTGSTTIMIWDNWDSTGSASF